MMSEAVIKSLELKPGQFLSENGPIKRERILVSFTSQTLDNSFEVFKAPASPQKELMDLEIVDNYHMHDKVAGEMVKVEVDTQYYKKTLSFFMTVFEKFTLEDIKSVCHGPNVKINSLVIVHDKLLMGGSFQGQKKVVVFNWRNKSITPWIANIDAVDLKLCENFIVCADLISSKVLLARGAEILAEMKHPFSVLLPAMMSAREISKSTNAGIYSNVLEVDRMDFAYYSDYRSTNLQSAEKRLVYVSLTSLGYFNEYELPVKNPVFGIALKDKAIFCASLSSPIAKYVFNEKSKKLERSVEKELTWDESLSFRTVTTDQGYVFFGGATTKSMNTFCFAMTNTDLKFLDVKKVSHDRFVFWPHKMKMFQTPKSKVLFVYCLRQYLITIWIRQGKFQEHYVHKLEGSVNIHGAYYHKRNSYAQITVYGFDTLVQLNGNSLLL